MIDEALKQQLRDIFADLNSSFLLVGKLNPEHSKAEQMREFLEDVSSCSSKIDYKIISGEQVEIDILKNGEMTPIRFLAIASGHEFSSFILAILNLDGQGKNLPDEFIKSRILNLQGEINITTYMSLSCQNCPEVVQALNLIAIFSRTIIHKIVDGSIFKDELEKLNIQAVPTVYVNGELFYVGRSSLGELLSLLEQKFSHEQTLIERNYDVILAGAGPAGCTSALYLARKGMKVALVSERLGGQVNETGAIENIPSVKITEGKAFAKDLRDQIRAQDNIDILDNRIIQNASIDTDIKSLEIKGGEKILAPQIIIATGAKWRKLNIPGESEYIGRGVAFCPHCDGPLFEGKTVAVIGGGNSGVEAAIDLSNICKRVFLLEFLPDLKADLVLQNNLYSRKNVQVFTNVSAEEILGDDIKVHGLRFRENSSNQAEQIELDGVFIQIGLSANSEIFSPEVKCNQSGEIEINKNSRTNLKGVYAAGDVSDVSYKQIVISMGEGAKAALSAFEDRIRELS